MARLVQAAAFLRGRADRLRIVLLDVCHFPLWPRSGATPCNGVARVAAQLHGTRSVPGRLGPRASAPGVAALGLSADALTLLLVALLFSTVLSACGGDEPAVTSQSVPAARPSTIAQLFLDALVDGDYASTAEFVDERHIAFLVGIEHAEAVEVAGILRSGLPNSMRADFWESFSDSLPVFSGEAIDRIRVTDVVEEFTIDNIDFVVVNLAVANGESEWILRRMSDRWAIDLLATFGADFLPNLRVWFSGIGSGEDAAFIRDEFEKELPSLLVSIDRAGTLSDAAQDAADELLTDFGAG